jgi:uncharacterized protein DUF4189
MRQLYVLLASAVIATTLIVVAAGASAAPASEGFLAVAYSRSLHEGGEKAAYGVRGTTLANAKFDALHKCRTAGNTQYPNQYALDCKGIAWVRDGWMGFAIEDLKVNIHGPPPPGYEPNYGWGIAVQGSRARGRALYECHKAQPQYTGECNIAFWASTQGSETPPSTFDGGSWNTPIH